MDVAVRGLCLALQAQGTPLQIHTASAPPAGSELSQVNVSRIVPGTPARLGWSPRMRRNLMNSVRQGDVVHNHSLWMMPNIYAGEVARHRDAKLVISPHGTLSEWSLSRAKKIKRLAGWVGQNRTLRDAMCFHVTAASELDDLRRLGFRQPVAVVPNGVDLPDGYPSKFLAKSKEVLFLSRLHPKKGLDLLLRVWAQMEVKYPNVSLTVAGPDENGYGSEMRKLSNSLGLTSVRFCGALVGQEKRDAFSRAWLYVLPTHSENFGITIAEALVAGTPVITTIGAPWIGLEKYRCGWWIERTERALFNTLDAALSLRDDENLAMGERGRTWIVREFGWHSIAERMIELYKWLQGAGQQPNFVQYE